MELLKDRVYYRQCGTDELLRMAQYEPNAELAVVLAERLTQKVDKAEAETEALRDLLEESERRVSRLDDDLYVAGTTIDKLMAQIDELKGEKK